MVPPLLPAFVRNVIYPVYRGLRGDRVLSTLEELERNQWLAPEEIEELQWRKLIGFLQQISTHVPYYRDLFAEAGLKTDDIQNPADLRRLPLLTKEKIRKLGSRIVTKDPLKRGYPSSTGGSTGEPLYFYCDYAAGPVRRASALRGYRWAGIDIGDKQVFFWGYSLTKPFKERIQEGFKNYFNNIMYLSTFDMSESSMRKYAARLRRYKPNLVVGYPSALALFVEYCKRSGTVVPRPTAVITSGERAYPHQREIIGEVFSSPVFDRYGSREFSNVANECDEHTGLHVFSDLFYVEVIHESGRPAQSGEVGEIVVTDLSNLYMPFLRYRTGDLAIPTTRQCACGRGLPLLDRIEGRTFDSIITPDGKAVGGFFWTWLSRVVPGIRQFQIEQRERSGIIFRIVPGPEWRDESRSDLESKIRENCGEGFGITFALVDEIPLSPAGKSKFIVSNIEERLVVKSKIHKAHITGEVPEEMDCCIIDEALLEKSNIAPLEKVLIVDNTNGARVESIALKGEKGRGGIIAGGAAARYIRTGDEVSIMSFTWSDDPQKHFSSILVDENNHFVRYLKEIAGEKL